MDPYCEAIAKLLVKDGQAAPRTLTRIMENLPYSRFTILKHLREMEISGLISKSTIARTSRGRPKMLYQPTPSLLRGEAVVQIPFSILSENCMHKEGKRCMKSYDPCEMKHCPILS